MAAYSGTPTNLQTWEEGDRQGKHVRMWRRLSVSLSSQGGLTNTLGAVALGFKAGSLSAARLVLFTDGSSVKRAVTLMTDGTNVYTADPQVSTDADRGKAADVTGTLVLEVAGLRP